MGHLIYSETSGRFSQERSAKETTRRVEKKYTGESVNDFGKKQKVECESILFFYLHVREIAFF